MLTRGPRQVQIRVKKNPGALQSKLSQLSLAQAFSSNSQTSQSTEQVTHISVVVNEYNF